MAGLLDILGSVSGQSPAASIDGNEFVLAAQKYGLPTDMDSMNKIVNLVNSGMDVDSAARALSGKGLLQATPKEGGLNASNYNNPFQNPNVEGGGLRAYPLPQGGYGGEMLPKSTGWLGLLQVPGKDEVMTEYSVGDERGDFPSLVPALTDKEKKQILTKGKVSKQAYIKAKQQADALRSQGKSPFYNAVE
jgi:hypothetical protein